MKSLVCLLLAVCMVSSVYAEGWKLKAGPAWRGGMTVKSEDASYAQEGDIWMYLPGSEGSSVSWNNYGASAEAYQMGDKTYDDGYNRMCGFTKDGNPSIGIAPGMTWNWSTANNSQRNISSDPSIPTTLTLSRQVNGTLNGTWRTGTGTRQTLARESNLLGLSEDDDINAWGVEVGMERLLYKKDKMSVHFEFSMAAFKPDDTSYSGKVWEGSLTETSYTIEQRQDGFTASGLYTETVVYGDPLNSLSPTTAADYAGTYLGNGPIINNIASTGSVVATGPMQTLSEGTVTESAAQTGSKTWQSWSDSRVDLEMDHYAFRAGPRIDWVGDRWSLGVAPRVSLNYVSMDAKRDETLYVSDGASTWAARQWSDKESEKDWLLGLGLIMGAKCEIGANMFLGANAGYEWMVSDAEVTVGPGKLSADLSGYEISLNAGLNF